MIAPIIIVAAAALLYAFLHFTADVDDTAEETAEFLLTGIKKAKEFCDERIWMQSCAEVVNEDESEVIYVRMPSDGRWYKELKYVEQLLENERWEAECDSTGRIWIKKIAAYDKKRGYIRILKKKIRKKYPNAKVESFKKGNMIFRITW